MNATHAAIKVAIVMRILYLTCGLLISPFALSPPFASAQQIVPLHISVTDASGSCLSKADIRLAGRENKTETRFQSDNTGTLSIRIPAGIYDLTIASPGFVSAERVLDVTTTSAAIVHTVLRVESGCASCLSIERPSDSLSLDSPEILTIIEPKPSLDLPQMPLPGRRLIP